MPQHVTNVSQMAPAVPPLASEKTLVTRVNSHVKPSLPKPRVSVHSVDQPRCLQAKVERFGTPDHDLPSRKR